MQLIFELVFELVFDSGTNNKELTLKGNEGT